VASVDEVQRHRRAHDAKSNESDFHLQSFLKCSPVARKPESA